LDLLDKRWRRALPRFDTSDLELVGASDFPEVLRQRAGVALALRDKRNPIVVGFGYDSSRIPF